MSFRYFKKLELRATQMHSNRIITIQRRAKRRLLVLAIAATAFVGYNALSLFAEDRRPIQPPVEKMSHVPGVKAVGIRMINPNGKLPAARIDTAPTIANLSDSLTLHPSKMLPLETSMPSTKREMTLPPSFLSLPAPSIPPSENKSPTEFSSLAAPVRISDASEKIPKGPFVVRITEHNESKEHLPNRNTRHGDSTESNQIVTGPDLVDIPVDQPRSMGQPAKMPPFVSEKSDSKQDAQRKVRIAITDSGVDGEISPPIPDGRDVKQPKNRFPQLVKSKPTQLAHTVVLVQSTNLDLQPSADQRDEFVPSVRSDSSLVPDSISSGFVSPNSKTVKELESAITLAVPNTFALNTIGAKNEPQLIAKHTSTSSTIDSIDSKRRSFDSSVPNQSLLATFELECLAATTMNLAGNLMAIAVQDENVCKALHNERTVSLVGNQSGTTLVQFWTTESGSTPQVVRVNVSQQWGRVQATPSDVKDIRQVITQGFPRSDVKILSKEDGTFEVRGTTDTEESAKRILELVRKLYLVPVKDSLTVSN